MRLKKVYIKSFGKFSDKTFDFNAELNTFLENNGWGKTTLTEFIKAMFYGLDDGKRHAVKDSARKRYTPWDSTEKFGGYVEFEWGKDSFKIERLFGSKPSDDYVCLTNLETGKKYTDDILWGSRIFKIDEQGFLSTAFFSQKDFSVQNCTSITSKFQSEDESNDENARSFNNAVDILSKKAKEYKLIRGEGGKISDTKKELFSIEEEIGRTAGVLTAEKTLKEESEGYEKQLAELTVTIKDLTEKSKAVAREETLLVKKKNLIEAKNKEKFYLLQIDEANRVLNGKKVSEESIDACIECYNDLTAVKEKEQKIYERAVYKTPERSDTKSAKMSTGAIIMFVLAIVLAIAGVVSVFAIKFMGLYFGLGLFLLAFGALGFGIVANKKEKEEKSINISKGNENDADLLAQYKEIENEYSDRIDNFLSEFNVDKSNVVMAFNTIKTSLRNIISSEQSLKEARKIIAELSADEGIMSVSESGQTFSSLNAILEEKRKEYDVLNLKLLKCKNTLSSYDQMVSELPVLEAKRAELTERIKEYEKEYKLVNLTLDYLKKADENIKIRYRKPLEDSLNKYIKLFSSKEIKATVDVDLNVSVIENGISKDIDYYSKGLKNLFILAERFALIDILYNGEKPFIVLDDPFSEMDKEKFDNVKDFVSKISKDYQILYFACHNSRVI